MTCTQNGKIEVDHSMDYEIDERKRQLPYIYAMCARFLTPTLRAYYVYRIHCLCQIDFVDAFSFIQFTNFHFGRLRYNVHTPYEVMILSDLKYRCIVLVMSAELLS